MKKYYTRGDWHWDHPFPGDVGEDGRWEIDLYTVNDCFESGYRGYAALAELEDGRRMTLILVEAEGINRSCYPTLPAAQSALDAALGANTPPLPDDRDAAEKMIMPFSPASPITTDGQTIYSGGCGRYSKLYRKMLPKKRGKARCAVVSDTHPATTIPGPKQKTRGIFLRPEGIFRSPPILRAA